jgi:murein DD-endopeptidase MepM/ murein hydrolase activator NlpD
VSGWVTKLFVSGLFMLQIGLPFLFFGTPIVARASILSIVSHIFSPETVTAEENLNDTSQKMPLLEAPINPVSTGNTNSPSITVVDNALIPDSYVTSATTNSDSTLNTSKPASNEITTYKVKSGDTVISIAKDNGISPNTIIWANNLKKDAKLTIGQNLLILPISGISHKIVSGDTLQAIALKYHGDAQEIAAFNDLGNSKLQIGDVVVIPDGEGPISKPPTVAKTSTSVVKSVASAALGIGIAQADIEVPTSSGYYMRPIAGGIRTQGIHGNNGVDLADACGTPIYASAAGEVIVSKSDGEWDGGYGNYVVISHSNGSQTLYAHMSKAAVSLGETVTKGQMIGTIGATGKVSGATGCHVHFEIRNGIRNPF